jgi:hypothetical protein
MPELPPQLPPERRPIGQVVAEAIRAYGRDFWRCLPLGLPLGIADQVSIHHTIAVQALIYWIATPLFAAAYVQGCAIVLDAKPNRTAYLLAVLIWLPFPALRAFYVIPGLAWLAFVGLAVPAAMVDKTKFRESLVRGRRLGVADYPHALGSISTLVIVVGLASNVLGALLHSQSESGLRVAVFLSELVLSPLLYLGSAILYTDQVARLRSRAQPVERAGAQVEP